MKHSTTERIIKDLKRAKAQAENANNLKSAFLANVSHELRTPLGAIVGFAELLCEDEAPTEQRQMYKDMIQKNSDVLTRLIDDLLDLSKVEAGRISLETCQFCARTIVEEICNSVKQSSKKNNRFHIIEGEKVPENIMTDQFRLRQILSNLIGNSVKFTQDGDITITINYYSRENKNFAEFLIQDNGIGISTEQSKKLFIPFNQAHKSTTQKFGGTGLGLALSRKIAKLLGGDVKLISSSLGKGSTFAVYIQDHQQINMQPSSSH